MNESIEKYLSVSDHVKAEIDYLTEKRAEAQERVERAEQRYKAQLEIHNEWSRQMDASMREKDRELAQVKQYAFDAIKRIAELENACQKMNDEICQTLGKALGYPWYKDDPDNFPNATDKDGVCVGDHVAESIAVSAANRIAELEAALLNIKSRRGVPLEVQQCINAAVASQPDTPELPPGLPLDDPKAKQFEQEMKDWAQRSYEQDDGTRYASQPDTQSNRDDVEVPTISLTPEQVKAATERCERVNVEDLPRKKFGVSHAKDESEEARDTEVKLLRELVDKAEAALKKYGKEGDNYGQPARDALATIREYREKGE